MVCTANDLLGWNDFPKGLRLLLLDEDASSAAEIRSKLEEMDYIVSTFCDENEALSAISSKSEIFHVAIVEVSTGNSNGSFKFLETARDLPTIMISNIHCLSTMMKCIALGAVEFLQKPLCEDKLRNIWQHVVHKAFNAGGSVLSESLKPVKESVVSMLQLEENKEPKHQILVETENVSQVHENDHELSLGIDKYPAPSTPQLEQGGRLLDDGDCQDQTNCSTEKECGEQDGESKSVETTCGNSVAENTVRVYPPQSSKETLCKEEDDSADGSKSESNVSPHLQNKKRPSNFNCGAGNPARASDDHNASGTRASRKKMKVDWTADLHKKFLQAVEQLGVDQAIPSRILELMKVEGLTRHNVASHLQKYRMHRRHILPKEDDRRWPHPGDPMQRGYYQHKPIMAFPPYHSNHAFPTSQVYSMWGPPNGHPSSVQMWGPPSYPAWQPAESWLWKPYPGVHADAWGCPVMPLPHGQYPTIPQNASGFHNSSAVDNGCSMPQTYFDYPAEDEIDKVVKEAISKPWLPLPLGLKPPSTDSVLAELSRQGISNIPPNIH